jgi:phosphatidate phosphatase APP1
MNDIVVTILEDSLILLITVLMPFILTSYVIALIPIELLQGVSSNQQEILANLTITKIEFVSNSTITFNAALSHIIHVLYIPSIILLLLDILYYYLKAKEPKRSLN